MSLMISVGDFLVETGLTHVRLLKKSIMQQKK